MLLRSRMLSLRTRASPVISPNKLTRRPISNDAPFPTYFQPPPPPPPSPNRPYFRIALYATVPALLSYGIVITLYKTALTDMMSPMPGSKGDEMLEESMRQKLDNLPLVKVLRKEQNWQEWQAYSNFSSEEKKHRLTSGPMGGVRGVGVQRVFWNEEEHSAVTVIAFGNAVNGWIHTTHGGALATIMDESLGRVALRSFPAGTGVTANLDLNYRWPVRPDKFYILTATAVKDESSDRKATIIGRLEDAQGRVCVEAKGIFVVPKTLTLRKITGQF